MWQRRKAYFVPHGPRTPGEEEWRYARWFPLTLGQRKLGCYTAERPLAPVPKPCESMAARMGQVMAKASVVVAVNSRANFIGSRLPAVADQA
jgi:hypothetical protein